VAPDGRAAAHHEVSDQAPDRGQGGRSVMASVQDRWFTERKDDYGRTVKVPTRLHGNTKIRRWRAHYRTPDGRQRNKTFARKVDADRFSPLSSRAS
jgi:hypothetical protein